MVKSMKKRPIGVWTISLFVLLSAIYTLFSLFLVFSGAVPLSPAEQSYFASLGIFDWLLSVAIGVTNIAAAIALLMLRKVALHLFVTAAGFNILSAVTQIFRTDVLEVLEGYGLISAASGIIVIAAIILYTHRLTQKGTLQ